jgi:hypothetical protein
VFLKGNNASALLLLAGLALNSFAAAAFALAGAVLAVITAHICLLFLHTKPGDIKRGKENPRKKAATNNPPNWPPEYDGGPFGAAMRD